jgi:hypothetical protein
MAGEITLERGLQHISSLTLDVDGEAQFDLTGRITDKEQKLDFLLSIAGTAHEKNLILSIPARGTTKKDLQITLSGSLQTGNAVANILVIATEDGRPFVGQTIEVHEGTNLQGSVVSDNAGRASFVITLPRQADERIAKLSVSLPASNYREDITVTVPALEKKKSEDAEHLILMSHHDGCGRFRVKARILKEKGVGMANKAFSIFFNGRNHQLTTNSEGECIFRVPGQLAPNQREFLTASVSGIKESARIRLRRRATRTGPAPFTRAWFFRVNNGRAFVLMCLCAVLWLTAIIVGPGKPVLNGSAFRGRPAVEQGSQAKAGQERSKKVRLSKAERFYNEAAAFVGEEYKIPSAPKPYSGGIKLWIFVLVFSIFTLIYAILSAREEITEAVEEMAEKLFDKSSDEVGDPTLERLARLAGMYSEVRRKTPAVTAAGSPDITAPTSKSGVEIAGHPSLGTLFKLDLLSDTLVELVPAVLRKIWGR